ncbi:single-stranded DNA-binding protein [Desertibacillus haloalkaliphilus]|uniref:single-stranded DNA-binding protein n=1 Tax=Desertibacillus haloalkaliphilus TaxID=1328930 RepID=UPI001C2638B2|nr:single-stranded DNA-binding protein [Desertibacillus haloalkaliphilus]MBU8908139.1 single-stranded DNA-binding protein [Desertibacillus haloalkaliphilus]
MVDINRVTISGRLVADPELHYTESQVAICRFTVASDRDYQTKKGDRADFIPVLVWRAYGERCANNLEKGQEVIIDGKIRSRNGTDQQGDKRTFIELHAEQIKFGAKVK